VTAALVEQTIAKELDKLGRGGRFPSLPSCSSA